MGRLDIDSLGRLISTGSVEVVEAHGRRDSVKLHARDLGSVEVASLVLDVKADSLASTTASIKTVLHVTLSLGLLVPRGIRGSDVASSSAGLAYSVRDASSVEVVECHGRVGDLVKAHLGDFGCVEVAGLVLGVEADGFAAASAGVEAALDGALGLGLLVPRGIRGTDVAVSAADDGFRCTREARGGIGESREGGSNDG